MSTTNKVNYKELLSAARQRKSAGPESRTLSMQASSDKGRVMFSSNFRRLQSKTQVFAQDWNASVRTRLTHSLEVASIGRYLAEKISDQLLSSEEFGKLEDPTSRDTASAFITFVEVACLLHDLGNPPFGHFGEASIREWFALKKSSFKKGVATDSNAEFDKLYGDFIHFDGNPQGFRIATRLQWVGDEFGYNLTYTQLAATLKYPWTPNAIDTKIDGVTAKKAGVFFSEEETLAKLQTALSLSPRSRHPLAYIMEAADDISYCLSDIEDALEKKVVRDLDVVEALRSKLNAVATPHDTYTKQLLGALPSKDSAIDSGAWFVKFRTAVTNTLVESAHQLYFSSAEQEKIASGAYFSLLRGSIAAKALLDVIADFSNENLYCSSSVRERELVGYQVITGILDKFGILLYLNTTEAEALLIEKETPKALGMALAPTLNSFLPRKHLKAYAHEVNRLKTKGYSDEEYRIHEWFARAHLIVDFLSGMTDDFAIVTYRRLYDGGIGKI